MRGSIGYAEHVKRYYVAWYHAPHRKTYKIYYYKGEPLYHEKIAEKLRSCMQADVEKGVFRIEQYTRIPCSVTNYLKEWLEAVGPTLAPATRKDYHNSIFNHLIPFFDKHPIELHEIQYDTLLALLNSIDRGGKGKLNVMSCLHVCLETAWRSHRIDVVPPFPRKKAYNIQETAIVWLPEERQKAVIEAIPMEHQPIFWWLKHTLRRPCEAMALHKVDFDGQTFFVHRSFSNRELTGRTKTGEIHYVPLLECVAPYVEIEKEKQRSLSFVSPYFFVNPKGKTAGKPYTHHALSDIWKAALQKTGESIRFYAGVKHSTASQLINECGYSTHELQMAGDWARLESVKKYAKVEVSARKALLEKKVIKFNSSGTKLERESRN
jgi:integrase